MVKLTAKFSFMEEYKLSDIAEVRTGPFGSQLHNEDYVSTGTPIVTVEHLGNRRFSKQNLPLVSDDDKKRLSKYLLQEGDIVFSRVGSVDRCSYVTSAENDWLFSGRCLRVRCGNNCHPLFLYYYFCKESVKQYIKSIAVGATMPSINTKLMAEIPILLPKLEEQRCIADILSSFDDKIELNRRINDNLEQQAQALFKSWFVDFEPFRGGEFVDSELESVTSMGDWAFWHCQSLKRITFPDRMVRFGEWAFYENESLQSVCIPEGVTTIPSSAFARCHNLTCVIMPGSLQTICGGAFSQCHKLTDVTIPDGVTVIETGAFPSYLDMAVVTCLAVIPPELGKDNFGFPAKILYVPAGSVEVYRKNAVWREAFETIAALP